MQKKEINHFKKSKDEKVRKNTKKIEIALSNLPKKIKEHANSLINK